MNNSRQAIRCIYIYILTHAKAGWAYDRQPREVWRRKRAKASVSKRIRICYCLLVHAKWEMCNEQRYKRPNFGRCWDHLRIASIERKVSNQRNKSKLLQGLAGFTSSRRLTPKEVAA